MDFEEDHNNFCIYCGERLEPGQNFCSQCGKAVYHEPKPQAIRTPSKYESRIDEIEQEYNLKQAKAFELVEKSFDPTHMSYSKFTSAIRKSNHLFAGQLEITRKMLEVNDDDNEIVAKELENKIRTLEAFVDKIEDLINELVIHLSSNKKDNEDIDNLFHDMDDLIDSVKDY
ncbi:zinc ribbon domain-containing protein [Methanobrevibacter sp.]|uniref:zinc ribbon domain-containing protein n=1 Tax=Methanobrevibacter sp. TaxID=66852 RepID=UPI00388DD21F